MYSNTIGIGGFYFNTILLLLLKYDSVLPSTTLCITLSKVCGGTVLLELAIQIKYVIRDDENVCFGKKATTC